MSEIVIIDGGEPEPTEPVIEVSEAVELIDSAIDHVAEAVSEAASDDGAHDDNMAFIAGVTLAAMDALTGRVDMIEARLDGLAPAVAEVIEAVEVIEEVIAEEPVVEEAPAPEPDEPPDTWRHKVNRAWFKGAKGA